MGIATMRVVVFAALLLVGALATSQPGGEGSLSLAQGLAEKSLVDELSENVNLGENAGTDTEDLQAAIEKYDKTSWKNFVSFQLHEQEDPNKTEPPRFIRHLDTTMVITTASNRRDQQDAAYMLRPPLCPPGDAAKGCPVLPTGSVTCFSLESVNYAGHFMSQEIDGNKVELRKPAGGQETMQTVCAQQGLGDAAFTSLSFLSAPEKIISNRNALLRLCAGADDDADGCGKQTAGDFNSFATFKRTTGTFVGTCDGPENMEDCTCVDGWMGSHCNVQCLGSEALGICNGHGACRLEERRQEARCECTFGWLGKDCSARCPIYNDEPCGGLHAGSCYKHPVSGPACDCKDTFRGAKCQLMCPGSSDGKACSGHGECKTDAQESEATCECEKGFLGAACDKKCPVLNGRICGGYGSCEVDEYGEASCKCAGGRHGEACGLKCPRNPSGLVCSGSGVCVVVEGAAACACEDGFLGSLCEHQCPGLIEGRVCSGHGQCDVGVDDLGKQQALCTCADTHGGEDCLLDCGADQQGNVCSGHGKCEAKGKCGCVKGWLGDICEHECPLAESGAVCNDHGKCRGPEGDSSKTACNCDDSFKGPSCGSQCPMNGEIICSGRGECGYDTMSSQSRCKCQDGAIGEACQFECPGMSDSTMVCSGHGHCSLYPDTNNPVAAKCSKCLDGFVGADCSLRCPGLGEDGSPCSGHGTCQKHGDAAKCSCTDGFKGFACNVECPMDTAGNACAAQGQCTLAGDHTFCQCKDGFLGDSCQYKCPRNTQDQKVCSNRGECRMSPEGNSALCECSPGSVGEACDAGCPVGGNGLPCSGHGQCALDANDGGCKCEQGWAKEDCSHPVCTSTSAVFNRVTGQCVCPEGNICCDPGAVEAKRAKETQIRKLRNENTELSSMLMETEQMLTEAKRRRLM